MRGKAIIASVVTVSTVGLLHMSARAGDVTIGVNIGIPLPPPPVVIPPPPVVVGPPVVVAPAPPPPVGPEIGVRLSRPPAFVAIPGTPVYYAPHTSANFFFYAHQYWVFADRGWYVGPSWSGPWAVVEPAYVPAPILRVPVRYYPVPPPQWARWRHDAPPRWGSPYGHGWREEAHEREWREREARWDHRERNGCPPGLSKQGRC